MSNISSKFIRKCSKTSHPTNQLSEETKSVRLKHWAFVPKVSGLNPVRTHRDCSTCLYSSFTSHNFTSSRIQRTLIILTQFSCQPQTSGISPVHSYSSLTGDNWRHTHHILRIQNFNKVITIQSKWLIQYTYLARPLQYGTGFFQMYVCGRPRIRQSGDGTGKHEAF